MRLMSDDSSTASDGSDDAGSPVNWRDWKITLSLDCLRAAADADTASVQDLHGFKVTHTLLASLREVAAESQLFLVHQVSSDAEADAARSFLAAALPGFPQHHLVFVETLVGRKAAYRQLNPSIAVDSVQEVAQYLAPVLPYVCLVTPTLNVSFPSAKRSQAPSCATSFEAYFAQLNAGSPRR